MNVEFVRKPMQKPRKLQPDCPVRLYSYVCNVEKQSRMHCAQLRFVNCTDRQVDSLFLRVSGMGTDGKPRYTLESVPLAGCRAEAKSVFGEERLIFLPATDIEELEITVEWVLFSDGMIWKRLPEHAFDAPEALGMGQCDCGMWNATERCVYCARTVNKPAPQPLVEEEPLLPVPTVEEKSGFSVPELSMDEFANMMQETAFVLRSMQEEPDFYDEDEEFSIVSEEDYPKPSRRGVWIMLFVVVALALLMLVVLDQRGYFG